MSVQHIDPFEFCRHSQQISGQTAIAELARLSAELVDSQGTLQWVVTGGLDVRPMPAVRVSGDLRYESRRFEDDLNSRLLSAGLSVDARASWAFAEHAEVYLAVDNLFDEKLETGQTADGVESFAQPQTVRLGFSFRR